MILSALGLLQSSPLLFLVVIGCTALALLMAVTVHEASHALIARWQGDETAYALGRISLNPIRHLDPIGTLMMLTVGFGWGKPVPVNPWNFRRNGPLLGGALVSLAGPASNFLLAAAIGVFIRAGVLPWRPMGFLSPRLDPAVVLSEAVGFVIFYNIALGVFNLLPLAPLDGFKVVLGILPRDMAISFSRLEPYGIGILMVLFMMGSLTGYGLGSILGPIVDGMQRLLVGR